MSSLSTHPLPRLFPHPIEPPPPIDRSIREQTRNKHGLADTQQNLSLSPPGVQADEGCSAWSWGTYLHPSMHHQPKWKANTDIKQNCSLIHLTGGGPLQARCMHPTLQIVCVIIESNITFPLNLQVDTCWGSSNHPRLLVPSIHAHHHHIHSARKWPILSYTKC